MPTFELIPSIIPSAQKPVEPPIPTRTVSTRFKPPVAKISGQPSINSSPGVSVESKTPVKEESVRLSGQVSLMARKEQAFRQRELALKEREKSIELQLEESKKFEALKEKLKNKDFSEAEALGLSYEEYTKYVLDKQGGQSPELEAIRKLQSEIDALKKGTEESQSNQYEETIGEYKKEIARLVSENPEYSSVKELKREDAVLQLILDAFEADGEELTVNEAARQIEDYLVDYGKRFIALPKFKKESESVEDAEEQRALPRPVIGTLKNNMTVESTKPPLKSLQYLSESERYAEARRRVLERRQQQQQKA